MTTVETVSISASLIAVMISVLALYLTNFWRGKLHTSAPTQFFLGYSNDEKKKPHICIHSFLYSTGNNGRVLEHLYVEYEQSEQKQTFNVWYAGQSNARNRIGGLRVTRDGINLNNLFYTPNNESGFKFISGKFTIRLHARMAGEKSTKLLNETILTLSNDLVLDIESGKLAVFDIRSTGKEYHAFSDTFQEDETKRFLEGFHKMTSAIEAKSNDET